ncbi:MAG: hypothetical protein DRI73_11280 [Bacteroidetes bacterium]|nr:MAG: hypothetical protein DRI73_11280 [Bacteroidota bacterium]
MPTVDRRIIEFINEHHVLTLATSLENEPWCANCFYVYLEKENEFVFTSDMLTKHIQDSLHQPLVAGSVVLETNSIGKIRGLQFQGEMVKLGNGHLNAAKKAYLKRFPVAMLMKTTLWAVKPVLLKFTDNRLGFGKKLLWKRRDQ